MDVLLGRVCRERLVGIGFISDFSALIVQQPRPCRILRIPHPAFASPRTSFVFPRVPYELLEERIECAAVTPRYVGLS